MPSYSSSAAGPMPERCRMAGEWMAPAQRITSCLAAGAYGLPSTRTRTAAGVQPVAFELDSFDQGMADDP